MKSQKAETEKNQICQIDLDKSDSEGERERRKQKGRKVGWHTDRGGTKIEAKSLERWKAVLGHLSIHDAELSASTEFST